MTNLIKQVDDRLTAVAADHPQFAGKKALLLDATPYRGGVQATPPEWRTDFLTQMGLVVPEVPALIPRDQMASVLDSADVLIWTTESDQERDALLADPVVAELATTKADRNIFTTKELAGAIAFASPLSYPVVADQLPQELARVLG
jgi:iron complex transport system substrate-binding protein